MLTLYGAYVSKMMLINWTILFNIQQNVNWKIKLTEFDVYATHIRHAYTCTIFEVAFKRIYFNTCMV